MLDYIKSEHIKKTKKGITGYFVLADDTITHFTAGRLGIRQWGNCGEKLALTQDRVENLARLFVANHARTASNPSTPKAPRTEKHLEPLDKMT